MTYIVHIIHQMHILGHGMCMWDDQFSFGVTLLSQAI